MNDITIIRWGVDWTSKLKGNHVISCRMTILAGSKKIKGKEAGKTGVQRGGGGLDVLKKIKMTGGSERGGADVKKDQGRGGFGGSETDMKKCQGGG